MFTALGIYTDSFEKPFLQDTSEFYASEGVKYMQQSDVPDYLKHVDVRSFLPLFFLSNLSTLVWTSDLLIMFLIPLCYKIKVEVT